MASAALWARIETGSAEGLLAAHALTTIHYLVSRQRGASVARTTVNAILSVLGVAPVDADVIRTALDMGWTDFEDAVTAAAAARAGCDVVVTRDPAGFPRSPVQVLTPEAAAAALASGKP